MEQSFRFCKISFSHSQWQNHSPDLQWGVEWWLPLLSPQCLTTNTAPNSWTRISQSAFTITSIWGRFAVEIHKGCELQFCKTTTTSIHACNIKILKMAAWLVSSSESESGKWNNTHVEKSVSCPQDDFFSWHDSKTTTASAWSVGSVYYVKGLCRMRLLSKHDYRKP